MHVVIAGGRGLLGRALAAALRADGHVVAVLTRRANGPADVSWNPKEGTDARWRTIVGTADAVINLAGESIAGGRWSTARKAKLLESRIDATRALTVAIVDAPRPPAVFLSASAIGYYGPHGDEPLTEESPPGADFLARVCHAWEQEAQRAANSTRVVALRTGVVLARDGGALPRMALPFRLFAGGPVGSGRQYVSWIHIADWVDQVHWALTTAGISGAMNLTAPQPVTNREFASALGHALRRPSFVPTPALALRLALGEMSTIVLDGQRVLPARATALGFRFGYPQLEPALRSLYP